MDCVHHQALMDAAGQVLQRRALVSIAFAPDDIGTLVSSIKSALPRWTSNPEVYALAFHGNAAGAFTSPIPASVYELAWALEINPRPAVAFFGGPVGAKGLSLGLFGTHRIASPKFSLAFDDLSHGRSLAPGSAWFLAKLSSGIGAFLLLTGAGLDGATARRLGILTHTLDRSAFDAVIAGLMDAEPVDPLLDDRQMPQTAVAVSSLADEQAQFAAFSGRSLADVQRALQSTSAPWAIAASKQLAALDTLRAALTIELLHRARSLDLREALILEWRMAQYLNEQANIPTDLSPMSLAPFFAPRPTDDLALAPRPRAIIATQ